jgi:ribosomal protein S18 acetylase RimI-like enzyme
MESANQWLDVAQGVEGVRVAGRDDAAAITRLLREAPFSHIHADWHFPGEWLGLDTFVVIHNQLEEANNGGPLFSTRNRLRACLAVAAEPPPAAWVRLAAVTRRREAPTQMAAMLSHVLDPLVDAGVTEVAWLLLESWPESWLPDLGFEKINEVITYFKSGTESVPAKDVPGLTIRPANEADFAALEAIEADAFEPIWRHSAYGLALAHQQALSFDVATLEGQIVGFQFSSATRRGAHLSRITVDPALQQSGIGTVLLDHTLRGYRDRGIASITLNTQIDNIASQRLYERFGFFQNGERFPVWSAALT